MVMPIYEYEHVSGPGGSCAERFEAFQRMSETPLEKCPACGGPCRKVLSTFGVGTQGKSGLLSKSNLEAHGFSQFKRRGKGYYEKTAGVGPSALADGD